MNARHADAGSDDSGPSLETLVEGSPSTSTRRGPIARPCAIEWSAFHMDGRPDTLTARVRRGMILSGAALGLAVIMTWPLAAGMTALGRSTGGGDGPFHCSDVPWGARPILVAPVPLVAA